MALPGQQSAEGARVIQNRQEKKFFAVADQAPHVEGIDASCVPLVSLKRSDETKTRHVDASVQTLDPDCFPGAAYIAVQSAKAPGGCLPAMLESNEKFCGRRSLRGAIPRGHDREVQLRARPFFVQGGDVLRTKLKIARGGRSAYHVQCLL